MLPIPPHKTPISMLQELCARHDLTPDYKMVSVEGQVHQPTFIFRVAVGESSATASGQSKKKAKHAAARRVLEQLLQPGGVFENQELLEELRSLEEPEPTPAPPPPVPQMEAHVGSVVKSKPKLEDAAENNPVGTLQELCMKRRWRPPYYETVCEEGLPHERTFDIACYVNEFKETGKGKSKRLAKRQAAQSMIEKIQKEMPEELKPDGGWKATGLQFRQEEPGDEVGGRLVPAVDHQQHVSHFVRNLRSSPGNILLSLHHMGLGEKGEESIEILSHMADEQHFDIHYIPLSWNSAQKKHYCLVQLTNYPTVVCFGSGHTEDLAKADAAYSALQYLQVLSKNIPKPKVEEYPNKQTTSLHSEP